ncbi:MAG: hypothetical protein SWO11_19170 [Thermodesulfobacteriota bacterium]|nr:hypothetical protein [Thermodesulfobacteriota bacterium]
MSGKIFISCGQADAEERQIAAEVSTLLVKQGFPPPYVAIQTQTIQDVNFSIISNLRNSDYYIFIDFAREKIGSLGGSAPLFRGSVFTNQELAIAYVLEFQEVLYLQQEGVNLEGLGKYLLSNAVKFKNKSEVPQIVEQEVKKKNWLPTYSRHLTVGAPTHGQAAQYTDHTGIYGQYIWLLEVQNLRHDTAAFNTVVRVNEITLPGGNRISCPDREFLKWAGKSNAYSATILPRANARFDLFALNQSNTSHLYLHSEQDVTPRKPILNSPGNYILHYQLFSKGFPLLDFNVNVRLAQGIGGCQAVVI